METRDPVKEKKASAIQEDDDDDEENENDNKQEEFPVENEERNEFLPEEKEILKALSGQKQNTQVSLFWSTSGYDSPTSVILWPENMKIMRKSVNRLKKLSIEDLQKKHDLLIAREKRLQLQLLRARLELLHVYETTDEHLGIPSQKSKKSKKNKRKLAVGSEAGNGLKKKAKKNPEENKSEAKEKEPAKEQVSSGKKGPSPMWSPMKMEKTKRLLCLLWKKREARHPIHQRLSPRKHWLAKRSPRVLHPIVLL